MPCGQGFSPVMCVLRGVVSHDTIAAKTFEHLLIPKNSKI